MKNLSLTLLVFISLLWGCKKTTTTTPTAPVTKDSLVLDFSYKGSLKLYDTVYFFSTAPAGSTFFWQFGDGGTSVASTPTHVYTVINGNNNTNYMMLPDTVILTINNDTAHRLVKALRIRPNPQLLVGSGNWTGGRYKEHNIMWPAPDTAYTINDTSFNITVVNDSTIRVWGQTVRYNTYVNAFAEFQGYISGTGPLVGYNHDTVIFAHCQRAGHARVFLKSYYQRR